MMPHDDAYLIEFYRLSDFVKATAVDPVTGEEAVCVFPSRGITENYMQAQAVRLLRRKISDKAAAIIAADQKAPSAKVAPFTPGKGGVVV